MLPFRFNSKIIVTAIFFLLLLNTSIGQVTAGLKVVKKYYDRPKNTRLEEIYTINAIGQKQGNYKWYNIFSVTTSPEHEGNYKNDMLDGISKRYYTFTQVSLSGIVKETREFKENKKNGKEIIYDYVYNGEYASAYTDENKIVEFIQKGKRVIREELEYLDDIKISEKRYYANGKIAVNQKFDKRGYLVFEMLTNETGVLTYENRFDDQGNFIRKFKLYPNGKLNILNEKDSTGTYINKEYYETGVLKTEQRLDASDKKLYEIYYDTNGKIKRKTVGFNEENYFEDGTLKERTTKNTKNDIIENIVYKYPGKLESKYVLKGDGSTVFKKFDENNDCVYTYELAPNKNSVKTTKKSDGGYVIEKYNQSEQNKVEEVLDAAGKLRSKASTEYRAAPKDDYATTIITYNNIGGYVKKILVNSSFATEKNVIESITEADSTGAYKYFAYSRGKIYKESTFDKLGRKIKDSTGDYKIDYDTTGDKRYEIRYNSGGSYVEYKYQKDGTIRFRAVSNNSTEKYPPESILSKFSQSWQKNIKLATIYFDEKGNKDKIKIFDAAGDITKEIKIKNNDETQYFIYFLKVN